MPKKCPYKNRDGSCKITDLIAYCGRSIFKSCNYFFSEQSKPHVEIYQEDDGELQ